MTRALQPSDVGTLVELLSRDRAHEAEQRARKLLAIYPNAPMLWKVLGVSLLRQGKEAIHALRRTTELMPDDAEAHGNLGAALCNRRQWNDALVSLRRALEIQPGAIFALIDAADALRALGRAADSVPLYQRALEANPRLADAHNNLGNAFLELRRYENAVAAYVHALRLEPQRAQIHCNLGNALIQLGRFDDATTAILRALELDPTLAIAHNHRGVIHAARGDRETAAKSFRRALERVPDYVDALMNLADVSRDLGMQREALAAYARATEIEPSRAELHCRLGNALFESRRVDDALICHGRALNLKPDYPFAHASLAAVQRHRGHAVLAESSCKAALSGDPDFVPAITVLAELRADQGRFEEARDLFQRAIAIDPRYTPALVGAATIRKMTDEDVSWRRSAENLLATPLPLGQEISLRYALGKYFDDIAQYDAAFQQYQAANELTKRHRAGYDREKLRARVSELIHRFDGSMAGGQASEGLKSQVPVLIVGMPRSGTTLAEQILASHPEVFGAGEVIFWDKAYSATTQPLEMARQYLERLTAISAEARRVVDKMPANWVYLGLIHAVLPHAKIIHMQRHPIDTCLSIYFQDFYNVSPYANDLDDLAHYYGEYVRATSHWRSILPSSTLLEVPYEGLIDDQEGWTRRMLEFIGLPWDPACLDFQRTRRSVITASKWQVRQKIHARSVGRWKHYEAFIGPLKRLLPHAG